MTWAGGYISDAAALFAPLLPAAHADGSNASAEGPLAAHAALFERAFFINADDSPRRRAFMEGQLQRSGVRYERWPAIRGRLWRCSSGVR